MNKSLTALLISAFVIPGGGHFYLKKPIVGIILAGISIVSLYFIMAASIDVAQDIVFKIQSGEIPLVPDQILEAVHTQLAISSNRLTTWSYLIGICWIIGMIDSFRVGRLQDNADKKSAIKVKHSAAVK